MHNNKDSNLTLCLLARRTSYFHTVIFFHEKDEMPCKAQKEAH